MQDWFAQLTFHGYAILPGVLSDADLKQALQACDTMLSADAAKGSVLTNKDLAAYGVRIFCGFGRL